MIGRLPFISFFSPFSTEGLCACGMARGGTAAAAVILLSIVSPLSADHTETRSTETERIDFRERPEAWAMKYFAGITLFSGFGPPERTTPGSVRFGFEVADIPKLDRDERRVGFRGTKEDDTNKAPLVLRPRLTIGLSERVSLTGSYVPPARVFDAKTELAAVSLNWRLIEAGPFAAGLRGFAQYGKVEADITCPKDKLHRNEYAICHEASDDEMRMRTYGLEIGASYRISQLRDLAPYLTASYQSMRMEFQTDAVLGDGSFHDQSSLTAKGETWAIGGGLTMPITERLDISAGVVYMPNTVRRRDPDRNFQEMSRRNEPMVNARFQVSYSL